MRSQKSKTIVAIIFTSLAILLNGCGNIADSKTWEGEEFTFTYPATYIADENGLWTEEGYEKHLNPPEQCSVCQIPYYEIKTAKTEKELKEYVVDELGLSGKTLEEASNEGIGYNTTTIGENDFIKITSNELFETTDYYTKNGDLIVIFRVYSSEKDNDELKNILSTLKF